VCIKPMDWFNLSVKLLTYSNIQNVKEPLQKLTHEDIIYYTSAFGSSIPDHPNPRDPDVRRRIIKFQMQGSLVFHGNLEKRFEDRLFYLLLIPVF